MILGKDHRGGKATDVQTISRIELGVNSNISLSESEDYCTALRFAPFHSVEPIQTNSCVEVPNRGPKSFLQTPHMHV